MGEHEDKSLDEYRKMITEELLKCESVETLAFLHAFVVDAIKVWK